MIVCLTLSCLSLTQQTCAVCLEDFKVKDELGVLPCQHAFHRKWVQERKGKSLSALLLSPATVVVFDLKFSDDEWMMKSVGWGSHCSVALQEFLLNSAYIHSLLLLSSQAKGGAVRSAAGRAGTEIMSGKHVRILVLLKTVVRPVLAVIFSMRSIMGKFEYLQ